MAKTLEKDFFKGICDEATPHIKALQDIIESHGLNGGISLFISNDGYFTFDGSALHGWELNGHDDGTMKIRYQYSEEYAYGKGEQGNE